ncbi:B-cell receptor-associated protein 31 isoform X1 [Cuculus canorus]|uniref:B-cell receptor-associated protein 31 isoform X1 n=1 Tax=Cuculus canorus TaxID=55661 RepID=UPI0023AB2077|nr:B-cell receptor-associated protein 31 isoform X1 [Cuculus canorus]
MSLQWTAVAAFLYAEVFLVLLLCVPFISATRWQKIFKSRLVGLAVAYGNTVFVVLIVILVLLLLDAVRETRKYDVTERLALQSTPGALEHFHMKLFRAQRNLYLAGFALLLSFLLRRLVTLISQQAVLGAAGEAFRKQAEGAGRAARRYMEENDALRKRLQEDGGEVGNGNGRRDEVERLKEELAASKRALLRAQDEAQALRRQAEALTREYDRLLEEHSRLQAVHEGPRDKKGD